MLAAVDVGIVDEGSLSLSPLCLLIISSRFLSTLSVIALLCHSLRYVLTLSSLSLHSLVTRS